MRMRMQRAAWALAVTLAAGVALWLLRTPVATAEAVPSAAPAVSDVAVAMAPADARVPDAPARSPVSAQHAGDEAELCGGLWVKTTPDGNIDDDDLRRVVRLPEARTRLLQAVRADPNEFAQAAAIRLALIGSEPPPRPEGAAACEPAPCEAQRHHEAQFAQMRDALVQRATTTRDARVYALALKVCGPVPNETSCRLLSADQWARLEPGNAAPWLSVLADAAQRRDAATQNEALHRIATSTRSDQHAFGLPGLVLAHAPSDEASIIATLALVAEAIGVEAAWALPGYQALVQTCKEAAASDPNRRQTCLAVAELLVARSDTLIERAVGVRLGERLGWPADRVDRLRGEHAAFIESSAEAREAWPRGGCAGPAGLLDGVARSARLGEAGALRDWIATSGRQPADFIRVERERQARRAAEASPAAAASAASAAR